MTILHLSHSKVALGPGGAIKVTLTGESEHIGGRIVRLHGSDGHLVPLLYGSAWSHDRELIPVTVLPTCGDGVTFFWNIPGGSYLLSVDGFVGTTKVTVAPEETAVAVIPVD